MKRACRSFAGVLGALALLAVTSTAAAKRIGMNLPCHNCHEGQNGPKVSAVLSAARVEPGQSVTITITAAHPTAKVGGVLIDSMGLGAFELIDPLGTRLFDNTTTQATHAMPQVYLNGQVQFSFKWVAPAMVGAAELEIWSNAGNDNMEPQDDSPTGITTGVAVGCDAAWYYLDADKDGAGNAKGGIFSCEPIPDRILQGGDCNDQNPLVNPAMPETCNSIDDNCDGRADEGFQPVLLVTDGDGDGYGAKTGMTMIGCPPQPGFAPSFDDCDDTNAAINPGAAEVMNGRDDNCNGRTDEVAPPADVGTPAPTGPAADPSGCAFSPTARRSAWLLFAPLLLLRWARRRHAKIA